MEYLGCIGMILLIWYAIYWQLRVHRARFISEWRSTLTNQQNCKPFTIPSQTKGTGDHWTFARSLSARSPSPDSQTQPQSPSLTPCYEDVLQQGGKSMFPPPLHLALGLWLEKSGCLRTDYVRLREVLQLQKASTIHEDPTSDENDNESLNSVQRLPLKFDTLKRQIRRQISSLSTWWRHIDKTMGSGWAKSDVGFVWTYEHQRAFDKIKRSFLEGLNSENNNSKQYLSQYKYLKDKGRRKYRSRLRNYSTRTSRLFDSWTSAIKLGRHWDWEMRGTLWEETTCDRMVEETREPLVSYQSFTYNHYMPSSSTTMRCAKHRRRVSERFTKRNISCCIYVLSVHLGSIKVSHNGEGVPCCRKSSGRSRVDG